MYSLLLVEDEELIRKGMRHCLDWSKDDWISAKRMNLIVML